MMLIFVFIQLLAAIGMIYGFVEINSPQKMLGANMAVEGIIHEEIEVTLEDNLEDDDEIDDFNLGIFQNFHLWQYLKEQNICLSMRLSVKKEP